MSYLFYLDGTLYDNPSEDRDLRTTLKRNSNLNGILVTQDAKVSFTGDAYTYLYDTFFAGLCDEVEVEIWEVCDDYSYFVYGGVIKIADIKIDFQRCKVEASIEDNSFFSYINNNKSIKVRLDEGTKTKTGEDLDPLPEYQIGPFKPCIGTVYTPQMPGWRVYDVMQYILDYITDNRIELQSDLLTGQAGNYELFMSKGAALRTKSTSNLADTELSFKELYEAIQRIYNVAFRIEQPAYGYERAILRIEKQDYFYGTQGDLLLEDVKDLEISTDESQVYSQVLVGGGSQDGVTQPGSCPSGIVSTIDSDLFGWAESDFHLFGQCNTDNQLELTHDFQIASNVIEDVMWGASPDFDDDLFLIEIENVDTSALTCDAVVYEYYGTAGPPFYYNLELNNSYNITRWGDFLHNSVQQYLSGQLGAFRVTRGQTIYTSQQAGIFAGSQFPTSSVISNVFDPTTAIPLIYNDDTSAGNYNIGGNYNTGTGQYTCPKTGNYTFTHKLFYAIAGLENNVVCGVVGTQLDDIMTIQLGVKNSTTGVTPLTQVVKTGSFGNGADIVTASFTIPCTSGDIIEPVIIIQFTPVCGNLLTIDISESSYFEATSTPDSGGGVQQIDTSEFKALLFKFDYPLDGTTFRDIMDDPTQLITITSNDRTFVGWIDELKYGWEGKAQITLRANAAIQDT